MFQTPLAKLTIIVFGFIGVIAFIAQFSSPQNDLGAFAAPSLIAAYLGGVLSIISPCSVAVLPAFFAITFREKQKITRALFVFFLGLIAVFVPIGIGASFLARAFFEYRDVFLYGAGFLLIAFGMMTVFGKSFHLFSLERRIAGENPSSLGTIFFTGALFAFGTGACAAAIYGGILTLAAAANSIWYGVLLLVLFAAGLMTPLYILSVYFDRAKIADSKWLRGRLFEIRLAGKTIYLHSTNIIAGLLLTVVGIAFILWKGTTSLLPFFDKIGLVDIYYKLNEQVLLGTQGWNAPFLLIIGIAVLVWWIMKDSTKNRGAPKGSEKDSENKKD